MTARIKPAGLFFLAGIVFVVLVDRLATVACNGTCPAWFAGLEMAQLLFPLAWAIVGFSAPSGRRALWLLFTAVCSSAIAYALHVQTLHFTMGAVSG
ncbi:hypothetical protein [Aquabacterium sp.]|uniref:hypothetical protein n=1 Tax=Aquabacterium sp. TaxID=1872578 RepID=UPI00198F57C8|nr:hypothetical protein [Aquabacterium sp.]MBC7700721.1 hypothetical protein [Aquabacterium sp.]